MFIEKKTDNHKWVEGNGRGIIYSFLSAAFKDEVNLNRITEFTSEDNLIQIDKIIEQSPGEKTQKLQDCLEEIKNWHVVKEEEQESVNLDLRKEFAFLFLTPHGVSPFESVYLGKKKLLFDRPWEKVRDFYRSTGVEKDKKEMHPEDHIAVELGFMASLSYLTGSFFTGAVPEDSLSDEEWNYALQVQCDFLEQHLIKWAPKLCEDIIKKVRHPFYRAVAEMTKVFLEVDYLMLKKFCSKVSVY